MSLICRRIDAGAPIHRPELVDSPSPISLLPNLGRFPGVRRPIVLRSVLPGRIWQPESPGRCLSFIVRDRRAAWRIGSRGDGAEPEAAEEEEEERLCEKKKRNGKVAAAAAATVVLGVGNRVLYKLALVPLKHYPFFLAQLATLGYETISSRFFFFEFRIVAMCVRYVTVSVVNRYHCLCEWPMGKVRNACTTGKESTQYVDDLPKQIGSVHLRA